MGSRIAHVLRVLCGVGAAAVIIVELVLVADLFSFEFGALWQLVGVRGALLLAILNLALAAVAWIGWTAATGGARRRPYVARVIVAVGALAGLWVLQYLFMEVPLTVRVRLWGLDTAAIAPVPERPDFAAFSLANAAPSAAAREQLAVFYERIRINNPESYEEHPISRTIDTYAVRYGVDAVLLFFLNYADSFYGEAVSGRVPFMRAMTAETVRDVAQIHLPAWVVESSWRESFVRSDWPETLVGSSLAFKLHYAVHKITLDVSSQPYALNTFSDVFLVLREYPEEFPELLGDVAPQEAVPAALRDSFSKLRDVALLPPYEDPYSHPALGADFYARHRGDLKAFARAAYYLVALDFAFATKVQALLTKYQNDYYERRLGAQQWALVPAWQRAALLAMIRDLLVLNVGRPAYNAYALPELNCTPLEFVARAAVEASAQLGPTQEALWRPRDYDALWAGAAYRLRVFNEVWALTHVDAFPGFGIESTVDAARGIIAITSGD